MSNEPKEQSVNHPIKHAGPYVGINSNNDNIQSVPSPEGQLVQKAESLREINPEKEAVLHSEPTGESIVLRDPKDLDPEDSYWGNKKFIDFEKAKARLRPQNLKTEGEVKNHAA